MSDDLIQVGTFTLPKPPEGYFWRIRKISSDWGNIGMYRTVHRKFLWHKYTEDLLFESEYFYVNPKPSQTSLVGAAKEILDKYRAHQQMLSLIGDHR